MSTPTPLTPAQTLAAAEPALSSILDKKNGDKDDATEIITSTMTETKQPITFGNIENVSTPTPIPTYLSGLPSDINASLATANTATEFTDAVGLSEAITGLITAETKRFNELSNLHQAREKLHFLTTNIDSVSKIGKDEINKHLEIDNDILKNQAALDLTKTKYRMATIVANHKLADLALNGPKDFSMKDLPSLN
jgi:hypothetical protein